MKNFLPKIVLPLVALSMLAFGVFFLILGSLGLASQRLRPVS